MTEMEELRNELEAERRYRQTAETALVAMGKSMGEKLGPYVYGTVADGTVWTTDRTHSDEFRARLFGIEAAPPEDAKPEPPPAAVAVGGIA